MISLRRLATVALALALAAAGGGCGRPLDLPPGCETPGAGWIAFNQRVAGVLHIRVSREDATCATTVASDPADHLSPTWSASTERLAYVTRGELWVEELVSGVSTTVALGSIRPGNVAFRPDGAKLAFDGIVGSGLDLDVYTVPLAGGAPTVVASTASNDAHPAWSADGERLFFVSNRSGQYEVWSARASDGLDPVQVTSLSRILGGPAVSPDGQRIAYTRRKPDGSPQVIEHLLATHAERVLSDLGDTEPAYDATGRRIAVTTYRYSPTMADVVVLDAETGALVSRVTACGGTCGSPAFPR